MKWTTVHGSQEERPLEIDRESSPGCVYVRRNIERVTLPVSDEEEAEFWRYDEAVMTEAEYEEYESLASAVDFVMDGKNKETAEILDALLGGAA